MVRCRNRPFSNLVDEVRERRQRHGLSGHVRLLLDTEQQSRLDNWIEFQNRHLKRLEQFEKERDKLKQELDDNQNWLATGTLHVSNSDQRAQKLLSGVWS